MDRISLVTDRRMHDEDVFDELRQQYPKNEKVIVTIKGKPVKMRMMEDSPTTKKRIPKRKDDDDEESEPPKSRSPRHHPANQGTTTTILQLPGPKQSKPSGDRGTDQSTGGKQTSNIQQSSPISISHNCRPTQQVHHHTQLTSRQPHRFT